jgi:probable rRNA maturation factor
MTHAATPDVPRAASTLGRAARVAAPALIVQVATRCKHLPSTARLRRWARAALTRPARVTLRIVGGREGERLNREFRRKPQATNVLAFCYDESGYLAGDVVLCAPVIAREAKVQGKSLEAHYAHLAVHGLLHLQGYDHGKPREARIMEQRETAIMRRLGFPDPYATEH